MFDFRVTMRRKHNNAPEEKRTNSEDKDPLGLGIVEKRVLMPPISPVKRSTPVPYQNNKGSLKTFSSVTDLDKIKFGLDENPPGNISFLTPFTF